MTTTGTDETTGPLLRDRLLDATSTITVDAGWSDVTMAKIAERVGVSRQTVYNELGAKPEIAEALVLRELERFLEVVSDRLLAHDDVVDGLQSAAEGALLLAADNPLLKAVLSSAHVGSNELLPLLTTNSELLIERATAVVVAIVLEHYGHVGLTEDELSTAADAIVRLVISNMLQPGKAAEQTAADIAWIARRVLHP